MFLLIIYMVYAIVYMTDIICEIFERYDTCISYISIVLIGDRLNPFYWDPPSFKTS